MTVKTGDFSNHFSNHFSNLTYAAFGDSITYGADFTRAYAQMDDPYPKVVSKLLGFKSFDNYGISGSTLCRNDLGLHNITETALNVNKSYDIVSVLGGVNDFNRNLPLGSPEDSDNESIYGSLDMIARHLKEINPDAFIFFMTPYKEEYDGYCFYRSNNAGYMLSDIADAVKTVAQRYGIAVLDLYELGGFEDVIYSEGCDGIHPNQDFILERTAPQVAEFIKNNLNR